ncbi:MAG: hypothetical protein ACP5VP_11295 [Candidatus Limnocylindrales bacterium]
MTLIHERPAEVISRREPDHSPKGDQIMGSGNATAIATLVERTTRHALMGHLPGARHDAGERALAILERRLPSAGPSAQPE